MSRDEEEGCLLAPQVGSRPRCSVNGPCRFYPPSAFGLNVANIPETRGIEVDTRMRVAAYGFFVELEEEINTLLFQF